MAENGYTAAPVGHMGRIPNYGKTQVNPMGNVEPPACIQNAMMTKDKKPFTYTPGGLDLSQIKTPSMARRLARQRSQEEHEQAYAPQQQNNAYHPPGSGYGPPPPPPPPSKVPAPPPPPALVIEAPSKSPKPVAQGERPEIVIPENPIGMLRKTNSPYHWEAEKAEQQRIGPIPKFVEKVPSPLTVRLPNQQPPQNYAPPPTQNYAPPPPRQHYQNDPESPIHRPEAQYANQQHNSPNTRTSPPVREVLQRQDSQFNKSPQPFAGQSPISNGSTYSPSPNNNWRQPEKRDSPNVYSSSPQSPPTNRGAFSPSTQQHTPPVQQYSPNNNYQNQSTGPSYHTLPRVAQRQPEYTNNGQVNNSIYNNTSQPSPPKADSNVAPWRTNTLNRPTNDVSQNINQQDTYIPTWKLAEQNNNVSKPTVPQKQEQYVPPWVTTNDANNNKVQQNNTPSWRQEPPSNQNEPRYQSTMSIPVTPRKPTSQPEYNNSPSQKEAVYVNNEPIYFCPDSPKSIPPWVKSQKEKTKTPPPAWVQRPLETRKSLPRELCTPPRETVPEPEWVKKSNELQRGPRDVISPPKYQQPVQPTWSTRPSENRKSIPKDTAPTQGGRVIPIQMEVSGDQRGHGHPTNLRIVIDMNQNPQAPTSAPYSQPTQRIMRVLSPQLVRFDDNSKQPELPTLNRTFQSQPDNQAKTRIIPIQVEGGNNGGAKQRVYYHRFTTDGPPRQSKAFKVLQVITGTQSLDDIDNNIGYSDL